MVIPENDRASAVRQSVRFIPRHENLNTDWIESILEVSSDGVRNVLAKSGLNLLQHDATAPAMEYAGMIFGLKQRGQLCLELLVFQVVKLNFHSGMRPLVLSSRHCQIPRTSAFAFWCRTVTTFLPRQTRKATQGTPGRIEMSIS
jgi:hypothetical protein